MKNDAAAAAAAAAAGKIGGKKSTRVIKLLCWQNQKTLL